MKVGGEKGGRSRGDREERGVAPSLWLGLGVVGVGLLPLWTVVLVSTSSAVLGVDGAGSPGAGEGSQRRGEVEREGGAVNRETLLSLLSAWELLPSIRSESWLKDWDASMRGLAGPKGSGPLGCPARGGA